jgi:hypothetical protein
MHGFSYAPKFFFTTLFLLVYSMSLWFRDIISEAEPAMRYNILLNSILRGSLNLEFI